MLAARAIVCASALALLVSVANATPPKPAQVIRSGIDEVLSILGDPATRTAAARDKRIERLHRVADRFFDWGEMARRSLGPTWRTIDASQRARFAELFPDLLADAYIDDLDRFRGDERVTVERSTEADGHAEVHTTVVTHGGEQVPMVYWLHYTESTWRVYDFSIEGVSLVNNYRESFSRFLVNHDFEALLKRLERKRHKPARAPD